MRGVRAYKEVELIDITPTFALVTSDTPVQAMELIRSQKKNAKCEPTNYGHRKTDPSQKGCLQSRQLNEKKLLNLV